MKFHVKQLPCEESAFLSKLEEYRRARDAHRITVGVPAPFPEYEIMRVIVDRDEPLEIVRDELQEQAKVASRDALAELDALKSEVGALKEQLSAIEVTTVK